MSTSETKINPESVGWMKTDSGSPTSSGKGISTATTSSSTKPTISLTTLDKIKRFFFSKEEWEAYLIEKLEEQEKKKGGELTLETKSDSTTKKNVVSWLKTVFPSQEDANSFLKIQIDQMQESHQSAPTSPNVTSTSSPSASAFTSPKELQSEAKVNSDKST